MTKRPAKPASTAQSAVAMPLHLARAHAEKLAAERGVKLASAADMARATHSEHMVFRCGNGKED